MHSWRWAVGLFIITLCFVPAAGAEEGDAILGSWLTENGKAMVEISREGDLYQGRISWLKEPLYPEDDEKGMGGLPKVDRENPDPDLRDRPILGMPFVTGFRYAGKGEWKEGRIYDPEEGKTYKSKMRLEEDGILKVRGFIGISLLGRNTNWTRPASDPSKE
jgi:uncharacterized protein (DUF2147 family)